MKALKVLKRILLVIVAVIVVFLGVVFVVWHNEIITLISLKQLTEADESHNDGATYYMKVSGDYYFDKLLDMGGVSSDSELISFITSNITKGLIKMDIKTTDIGCSSFTATADDGDRLFGRNYDMVKTNTMIVYTNPGGDRHSSVSTIDLRYISVDPDTGIDSMKDRILSLAAPFVPLDGVNDAGVAVGIYMTNQGEETVATDQQTDKPDITSTTMIRMILDYADDVDEAVELVEKYDLHDSANTSFHYMVADKSGKSAILEWVGDTDATDNDGSARKLVVTYGTADYQYVTNFIVADSANYYANEDEMGGLDRYEYLTSVFEENDGKVADEQAAMDILQAVGRRTFSGGNHLTIHSVVYNLTDGTALWVGNEHYGEEDYTFRLDTDKGLEK